MPKEFRVAHSSAASPHLFALFVNKGATVRLLFAALICGGTIFLSGCETAARLADTVVVVGTLGTVNPRLSAKYDKPSDTDRDTETNYTPSTPNYSYPSLSFPPGANPACATGQRELMQARSACASGNAAMCSQATRLTNALQALSCAMPALADGGTGPGGQGSAQPQGRKPAVNCVSAQRTTTGAIELLNGCGFTVSYSYCVQNPAAAGSTYGSAFDCGTSMDGKGSSTMSPGRTSGGFKGSNIVFVACEGAAALPILKGGRGHCG